MRAQAKVGTTFSYSHVEPWRNNEKDRAAALKTNALLNRLFIEPLLGMGYPVKDLKILQRLEKFYKDGDSSRLACKIDFASLQNYTREIVRHSPKPLIEMWKEHRWTGRFTPLLFTAR